MFRKVFKKDRNNEGKSSYQEKGWRVTRCCVLWCSVAWLCEWVQISSVTGVPHYDSLCTPKRPLTVKAMAALGPQSPCPAPPTSCFSSGTVSYWGSASSPRAVTHYTVARALRPRLYLSKACVQCLEVFLEDSDKSTEWLVFTQCSLG